MLRRYYESLLDAFFQREEGLGVTVISAEDPSLVGIKAVFDSKGVICWPQENTGLPEGMRQFFRGSFPEPAMVVVPGLGTVFVEPVGSCPSVLILGAGHVSQALANILSTIRYRTVVVDERPEFANTKLFPTAEEVVCDDFLRFLGQYPFDRSTFVVIVTRGHRHDRACLQAVLGKPVSYIGMIGSKRKVALTFEALEKTGVPLEEIQRVHAPIGLNIGAETPEEIALAIAAQLVAVNRQKRREGLDIEWLKKVVASEGDAAVATVVRAQGSTPTGAGARMLVTVNGQLMGTVGGGCGEAQVRLAAMDVIRGGKPVRLNLDFTNTAVEDEAMICGGEAEVFIELL